MPQRFTIPGYRLRQGSALDRALLVKFMQRTYREINPAGKVEHLAQTVQQHFTADTPVWWVESIPPANSSPANSSPGYSSPGYSSPANSSLSNSSLPNSHRTTRWTELPHQKNQASPVACLWMGSARNQMNGSRQAYVFLLYVEPEHRHQGIGTMLMRHGEQWARQRGDQEMGLQVFHRNQPALNLYEKLGYAPAAVWMMKPIV